MKNLAKLNRENLKKIVGGHTCPVVPVTSFTTDIMAAAYLHFLEILVLPECSL